jgi:1L-myo-inositol 1-phosphate cytidylyltransferase / CDP-L-myo-inositol myo-inositolphosphotransferase
MKALIIAAGSGSRFNGRSGRSHKALLPVYGVPVIERIVSACTPADEFVVVTGYRATELEESLQRIFSGRVRMSFIRNDQWQKSNGVSVLSAREALAKEDNFLLLMSDHLIEPGLVEKLCSTPPPAGGALLAVDRNIEGVRDLEDATKVRLAGDGSITAIGKDLTEYNAVDTGVFFCTPALFEALGQSVAGGRESLSDGVRVLCGQGRMGSREVTGCLWQDIDCPGDLAEARKRLWARVQKPRDGVVSRLFNRRVSGFITRRICALPLRPNHVTLFNLLLAGTAAWLMAAGHLLAGGALAQLFSILDGVDGELSRLKNQGSWFGGWLDNLTDRICDWMLICGAALAIPHAGGQASTAWFFLCLALVSSICYWSAMDSILVSGVLRRPQPPAGLLARVEKWFHDREMVFGITHDVYLLILAVGVAAGFPASTLAALIGLETIWWAAKLYQIRNAQPSEQYALFLADQGRQSA